MCVPVTVRLSSRRRPRRAQRRPPPQRTSRRRAAPQAWFSSGTEVCRALDVAPSRFDAWCRRPKSAHAPRDRRLRVWLRGSFDESQHRDGSPRIHEDRLELRYDATPRAALRAGWETPVVRRARWSLGHMEHQPADEYERRQQTEHDQGRDEDARKSRRLWLA